MATNRTAARLRAASGLGAFCLLMACGQSDDASSGSELTTTEAELSAAQQSMADAKAAAQACFDTYKSCKAAAGADEQACRDALKSCLPAEAPKPSVCAGEDAGVPAGDAATPVPGSDAAAPTPVTPRDGGARPARDAEPDEDGDADEDHAGPRAGHGQGGHGGRQCGAPRIPHDRFGACNDQASSTIAQGTPMTSAENAHLSCVAHSFEDHLVKLCAKASELCAQPGAPADVCQRISAACSNVSAGSDAGSAARPDAGP